MRRETGQLSTSLSSSDTSPKFIFAGRVRYCLLDDKTEPEVFKNFGEWSSIGGIFFTKLYAPNPDKNFSTDNFARPLFPNFKNYPLENEVVYIIPLPSSDVQKDVNSEVFYYFQPINIWNSIHHNAIPDPIFGKLVPDSQKHDYQQTEAGAVRRVTDGGTEIDLGKTFKEKLDIKTIQPFEGDIIHEGRWGQSIRFGSTVKNSKISNPWSRSGNDGDPITIIKNGQHNDGNDPWVPQMEDINKDLSSIYITSTQAIPIEVASKDYKSYSIPPTSPDKYNKEQIILTSGRLIFNSKIDSILFSSKDTINLNSVNSINIDSPKTTFNSKGIYLGNKDATESLILGDKFLTDLQDLLTQIIALGTALQTPIGTPTPYVPNISIPIPAVQVTQSAQDMISKIETYKSKISKTK